MEYPTTPRQNDDHIGTDPPEQNDKYDHIMVDLETMGTAVDAPIIAIGAVAFKYTSGVFTLARSQFYQTIDLRSEQKAGAIVDADTVLWWMKQSDEARSKLTTGGVPAGNALYWFTSWLAVMSDKPRIWGNGASFDNVILASAYKRHGIALPWGYYNDRCYRTLKNLAPHVKLARTGTHHNALDDAISQAQHLHAVCRELGIMELQ